MDTLQGRDRSREEVYSKRVKAGKRTYFFDVRETRGSDFYITITESKRRFDDGGYDKHKIFLYKEDFNKFQHALMGTIDHVKTELLPDYNYEEYDNKDEEAGSGESNSSNFDSNDNDSDDILSATWDD